MAEENGANKLTYFLIGFGLGAVVALLFAPKSGKELREDIAERTRRGIEKAGETYETAREKAKEIVQEAKETVSRGKERLAAAVEAGKQAYREEKRKAEPLEG
jgi:gas vesicle protein